MLDLARYQVANLTNGGKIRPIQIPHNELVSEDCNVVLDPLEVPSCIELNTSEASIEPSHEASDANLAIDDDLIDVLLENDDWIERKVQQEDYNEVSDEGSDHLDFLLDTNFWMNEDDKMNGTYSKPATSEETTPFSYLNLEQHIVSPVLSTKSKIDDLALGKSVQYQESQINNGEKLSRKEKNRIHARNRRMKVKNEHAKLKQSVDAYTQCKCANCFCHVLVEFRIVIVF